MLTTLKRFWRAYVVGPELTPAQLSAAKDVVENLISSSPVAVFSKSYCPYCTRAKKLLSSLGQEGKTQVIELDYDKNGSAIQAYLAQRAGVSKVTVPQVFIKQQLVGGCSNLEALHGKGKLVSMLA